MNSTLSKILFLAAGAAIGSAVTWKLVKTKYERIAQEEIDSVKEAFTREYNNDEHVESEDEYEEQEDEDQICIDELPTYSSMINKLNYAKIDEAPKVERPYVISPEEFGDLPDYEQISLTYFADRYLTDDMYELVEDVDNTVGLDSLTHFGEYEDDSVFVRNDRLKCDFEILLDLRKYVDIKRPHQAEV